MSADAKLDALMVKLGEVATSVAVIDERSVHTAEDIRDIKSVLWGDKGLLTRLVVLERRGSGAWWRNKALVSAVVGLLVALAGAVTVLATQ